MLISFLYCLRQAIRDSDYSDKIKETDIDQATSFLHDSGILLHYEDSTLLNDLYFINPQWLCSMLAKLITIKETNPYQKQGTYISTYMCCSTCVAVHVLQYMCCRLCRRTSPESTHASSCWYVVHLIT